MTEERAPSGRIGWRCLCGYSTDFLTMWLLHEFQCQPLPVNPLGIVVTTKKEEDPR